MKNCIKKGKKPEWKLILLSVLLAFILPLFNAGFLVVNGQTGNSLTYTGIFSVTADEDNKGLWTDNQWAFYKLTLEKSSEAILNLSYSGDLDLDLRLYVDEENVNELDVLAWDVTHCGIDPDFSPINIHEPAGNSQIRGNECNESLKYANRNWNTARVVYILVFCYDGVGQSSFTLESNIAMSEVEGGELHGSPDIQNAWNLFFIGLLASPAAIFLIVRRLKRPPKEQKELDKERGESKEDRERAKADKREKKEKGKPEEKKNVSMKARKAKKRR